MINGKRLTCVLIFILKVLHFLFLTMTGASFVPKGMDGLFEEYPFPRVHHPESPSVGEMNDHFTIEYELF